MRKSRREGNQTGANRGEALAGAAGHRRGPLATDLAPAYNDRGKPEPMTEATFTRKSPDWGGPCGGTLSVA